MTIPTPGCDEIKITPQTSNEHIRNVAEMTSAINDFMLEKYKDTPPELLLSTLSILIASHCAACEIKFDAPDTLKDTFDFITKIKNEYVNQAKKND